MQNQKNKHNNKKPFMQAEEEMDFMDENDDIGFEPCGAKNCICTDSEVEGFIEDMAQLVLMAQILEDSMERCKKRLEAKIKANGNKHCPNISMLGEDECDDEAIPF